MRIFSSTKTILQKLEAKVINGFITIHVNEDFSLIFFL